MRSVPRRWPKAVGERAEALVAPTISVGMAQHHMAFTGSMTLRPSTLIAVMRDWVASLARHGFRRFYFINGHGGNVATAQAAFSEIYADTSLAAAGNGPELKCRLRNWWQADGISGCRANSTARRRVATPRPRKCR